MWTDLSGFLAIPQIAENLVRCAICALDQGARFLTTIETTEERARQRAASVRRWKRKATPVRVSVPEIAEGVR
jgi:hypothetical protein